MTDWFLKIDGIQGDSTDVAHTGEIAALSFSWSENMDRASTVSSAGVVGKVTRQDMSFVKRVDKASTALFIGCATGSRYTSAVVSLRHAGAARPHDYLVFTLTDVSVTAYQLIVQGGDEPAEQFSLGFAKLQMLYREQRPDGTAGVECKEGFDFDRAVTF